MFVITIINTSGDSPPPTKHGKYRVDPQEVLLGSRSPTQGEPGKGERRDKEDKEIWHKAKDWTETKTKTDKSQVDRFKVEGVCDLTKTKTEIDPQSLGSRFYWYV